MLRGIYGDPERFVKQYWSKWDRADVYFTGDGAKRDEDGYFWVLGRVDDVHQRRRAPHRDDGGGERARRSPEGRGSRRRRARSRHEGPGRSPRSSPSRKATPRSPALAARAQGARRQEDRRDRAAGGHPLRRPICRRHGRARSCGACCRISPKARRLATRRPWPIPAWSRRLKAKYEEASRRPAPAVEQLEPADRVYAGR